MSGSDFANEEYEDRVPNFFGYDGFELVYQGFNRNTGPIPNS